MNRARVPARLLPRRMLLSALLVSVLLVSVLLLVASCSSSGAEGAQSGVTTGAVPSTTVAVSVAGAVVPAVAATTNALSTTDSPSPNDAPSTVPTTTISPPPTTNEPTTAQTTVPTATVPTTTPYGMPVADGQHASYAHVHHDYPASDVFVPGGCGSVLVSPVNGVVLEARRVDGWVANVDNPATRGGKSVAILGDDGVRYYLAHFSSIADDIQPGLRIEIGHPLGQMGMTGRAGACHVHFAISPPCPGMEWAVRRGVIWPWRYLDAWRTGIQLSPLPEIQQWLAAHPNACAEAMADPNAADS